MKPIKKSVGDKLLNVTIKIPPSGEVVDPKQTPVNLEEFLLGKWTWLVDDGCFSFCQEVTQQEREDFNNFITNSGFGFEKIYHMPIPEFIKTVIASSKIDWAPATHPIIVSIARHPTTTRTKQYKDQLERLINLGKEENYNADLQRIKIPEDIELIYYQNTNTKETDIQKITTTNPSKLTTAVQDPECTDEKSATHSFPSLKDSHEEGKNPTNTVSHEQEIKNRKQTKRRLNTIQEYIKKYLKKEPNADSVEIWNAIKDGKAEDIEIDSDNNLLRYRTKSYSKKYKDNEGKNQYAKKTYSLEDLEAVTNEIKAELRETEKQRNPTGTFTLI